MCSLLNPSLCIHALLITVIDFVFHLGFEITCAIRELCKEAALRSPGTAAPGTADMHFKARTHTS